LRKLQQISFKATKISNSIADCIGSARTAGTFAYLKVMQTHIPNTNKKVTFTCVSLAGSSAGKRKQQQATAGCCDACALKRTAKGKGVEFAACLEITMRAYFNPVATLLRSRRRYALMRGGSNDRRLLPVDIGRWEGGSCRE
jgi:hypothetical protein